MSRRGRALGFLARGAARRGRGARDRRRLRPAASSAATASCARSWSPPANCGPGRRSTPRSRPSSSRYGGYRFASCRPGALAAPGEALGLVPRSRSGRLLSAGVAAAPAALGRRQGPAWATAGGRWRSPSAAPAPSRRSARSRSARGSTSSSPPNRRAPATAAPTSPRRRCRCWRWPGRRRRAGGSRRDPGPDPRAGAAADRRRELRPPRHRAPEAADGRRASATSPSWRSPCASGWSSVAGPSGGGRAAGGRPRRLGPRPRRGARRGLPGSRARRSSSGSSATASASGRWRCCSPTPPWRR